MSDGVSKDFEEYKKTHQDVTWKEYVDLRFTESDKALNIASAEMTRRLEGMNEIRSQLDRQAATFPTRIEVEAMVKVVADRINAWEKVTVGAVLSIIIGLIIYFVTTK